MGREPVARMTSSASSTSVPSLLVTSMRVGPTNFAVPATFLADLRIGLPIAAKARALGDRAFEGTIFSIASQIDPVTRSITARALLPNPDQVLKPGLLMSVELLKNPREAVVVREEALVPQGRFNYVMVVNRSDGEAHVERREVVLGSRRVGEAEVVRGLEAGELIVTHGAFRLRPGQAITIQSIDRVDERGEPLGDLPSLRPLERG